MSDWKTLLVDVADRVATVTLNRPPVNAQNAEMRDELTALFDELSDREDVMAVVLTAQGKIFSAPESRRHAWCLRPPQPPR